MGLTGALQIGRSALQASQLAIQVTGNNIANVATPGYHRQRAELVALRGQDVGPGFIGAGVGVERISRAYDPAITARLRSSVGQEERAAVDVSVLATLESISGELTGSDLSSQLASFFNAWSELANTPSGGAMRTAVLEEGAALASYVQATRRAVIDERNRIDDQLATKVQTADSLVREIAQLNVAITNDEVGDSEHGNLRDQRDVLLDELSKLMDITVIERPSGAADVLVDSTPIVEGGRTPGLRFDTRSTDDGLQVRVLVDDPEEPTELSIGEGSIGGLLGQREAEVERVLGDLDRLASELIFHVNALHAVGRPEAGLTSLVSDRAVPAADQLLALNDPANETFAGLPFQARNGSFQATVIDENGNRYTETILVDLDGVRADGTPGFDDDTSMADIAAALDALPNVTAQISAAGRLEIRTDAGYEIAFAEDTSGVLVVLGINGVFTGVDASDIAVRADLRDAPELLGVGFEPGRNEVALSIAALRDEPLATAGGSTLQELWQSSVDRTAVRASAAQTKLQALTSVRQGLQAQEQAISGVSMDEESINLITFQQQYQGAARFIGVVDEMTRTLLALV